MGDNGWDRRGQNRKQGRDRAATQAEPLDPVALTLAVWLGLIVAVTGLLRMVNTTSVDAALTHRPGTAQKADRGLQAAIQMMAYGG